MQCHTMIFPMTSSQLISVFLLVKTSDTEYDAIFVMKFD